MKDIILKYYSYNFQNKATPENVAVDRIISYNRVWKIMSYTININFMSKDYPGKIWNGYIGQPGTGIEYNGILYSTEEDLDRLMVILERDRLADTLSIMPGGNDGL